MRARIPGEPWWQAWLLRPAVWLAYQFSAEARAIRRWNK